MTDLPFLLACAAAVTGFMAPLVAIAWLGIARQERDERRRETLDRLMKGSTR